MWLRFGEQNLHTTPDRKTQFRRQFGRPVCSPLPASPYASVSGSKIFTQLPAGKRRFAGGRNGRFAPRCQLALVAQFRGAKSSHKFRAPAWGGRLFQGAVCSPLPARPYASVSGSKIFTQFPRPRLGPAGFSKARFAPLSPLALVAPFRGANFFTSGLPTPRVTSRPPMDNCYV